MIGRLSQSSLATRIPRILCSSGRITGNLLRKYVTVVKQQPKEVLQPKGTSQPKQKKEVSQPKQSKQLKETSKKKGKESRISRIPVEPKKPSTSYNLFYSDFYHKKHETNPEFKVTQIAKLAGAEWSKLPPEEKDIYRERSKKMFDEYEESHKKWLDSLTSRQIVEENSRRKLESKLGKKTRLIKDPNRPKKPFTPYIHFVIEQMNTEAAGTEKGKDRIKELAYDWKNVLTPDDKKRYEEAFAKDKVRYEKELEAYKRNTI